MFDRIVVDRFWSKVDKSAGENKCWPWLFCVDNYGYGALKISGKRYKSHRIALCFSTNIMPDSSIKALHSCDNPICCNPSHLRWGSQTENIHDARGKGRLRQQKITHCPSGHPYKGENLIIGSNGDRLCRQCRVNRRNENAKKETPAS